MKVLANRIVEHINDERGEYTMVEFIIDGSKIHEPIALSHDITLERAASIAWDLIKYKYDDAAIEFIGFSPFKWVDAIILDENSKPKRTVKMRKRDITIEVDTPIPEEYELVYGVSPQYVDGQWIEDKEALEKEGESQSTNQLSPEEYFIELDYRITKQELGI